MPQEQTSSFIPVGALGEAFRSDAYILPQVHDLDGHELPWEIDGARGVLQLGSDGTAEWEGGRRVPVRVSSIRPDIYLVDGVVTPASAGTGCVTRSVSWVVDLSKCLITRLVGRLPDLQAVQESAYDRVRRGLEPTSVAVSFGHGRLLTNSLPDAGNPTPEKHPLHAPTDALVGLRNRYTYSPHEQYEHIYLNQSRFTWHCLVGAEKGLADTELCTAITIDEGLYFFVWQEKIVPTLGVILIDLDSLRTDGKIFGYDGFDPGKVVNFPVGAIAEVISRVSEHDAIPSQDRP